MFQLQRKEKEVNVPESGEFWKEYDNYLICTSCSLYHTRKDVSSELRSYVKKGFGIVQKKSEIIYVMKCYAMFEKKHCKKGLHHWGKIRVKSLT